MKAITTHALAVAFLLTMGSPMQGANPNSATKANRSSTADSLKRVLLDEEKGTVGDRSRRLKAAISAKPDFAPARWQTGMIKVDGKWITFDQAARRIDRNGLTQKYRKLREKTKTDLKGHLQLAGWCKRHGLTERWRSHLTAVLEKSPNHLAARKALGYVRIGGEWILRSELEKRRKDAVVARKNLQYWLPRIQNLRAALLGTNVSRRLAALKQLEAIDKPEAAEAIELGLGWHSVKLAPYAVERLASIAHPDATLSLARLAVASPWKSIRESATGQLKDRKFHHFVPQVLSVTRTPIRSRKLLFMRPDGSLFMRDLFYQEGRKSRRLTVADHRHSVVTVLRRARLIDPPPLGRGGRPLPDIDVRDDFATRARQLLRGQNESLHTAYELTQRRQAAAQQRNRKTYEINERVRRLISAISGWKFGDDPKELWRWWESYTGVRQTGPKPLEYRYYRTDTVQPIESYDVRIRQRSSCLAAGTPVWTERGLVAIDKIRVGDLVLSKDVSTGELAYKPVLNTTVGKPVPLMKLEIGTRTVTATPGHPFWVTGRGWMKARDIRKGSSLHDVTGTTRVQPAGRADAAKTYNLVVADFHTYFVGESKALSHDITPIEPTAALVPGLVRR